MSVSWKEAAIQAAINADRDQEEKRGQEEVRRRELSRQFKRAFLRDTLAKYGIEVPSLTPRDSEYEAARYTVDGVTFAVKKDTWHDPDCGHMEWTSVVVENRCPRCALPKDISFSDQISLGRAIQEAGKPCENCCGPGRLTYR